MSKRSRRTSPTDAAAAVKDKTTDAAAALKDKTTDAAAAVKDKAIAATDAVIDSIAAVTDAAEKRSRQTKKAARKQTKHASKQAKKAGKKAAKRLDAVADDADVADVSPSPSHRGRRVVLGLIATGGAAFAAARTLRRRSDDTWPTSSTEPEPRVAPAGRAAADSALDGGSVNVDPTSTAKADGARSHATDAKDG